ncbi:uncharacterized protein LACBIDRAFT_314992 [Laccaria bicolor S238N-H82]|uniref:Predicted protein n=1 Tax=Laccaria bicolor (strain S238N-H82 / ATCC MYA-4686) TaxID=486041 RepID=B0DZI9_LACBS|nr:uncharacterized protein LACBIDRAFT_314992 [Laccaria bicolor S238N-H82]EDQ99983.1 predicted protein [Laccaria bicolor S238N-H82]|eukprot:XP_001889394.1 predicted protein [Laccaria bicolor S238N-H82]
MTTQFLQHPSNAPNIVQDRGVGQGEAQEVRRDVSSPLSTLPKYDNRGYTSEYSRENDGTTSDSLTSIAGEPTKLIINNPISKVMPSISSSLCRLGWVALRPLGATPSSELAREV